MSYVMNLATKRSLKQHKFEWLVYRFIAYQTFDTPYNVYEGLSDMFLKEIDETGNLITRKPSNLSATEHNYYMEQIRVFFAEMDLYIPYPNEWDISVEYRKK